MISLWPVSISIFHWSIRSVWLSPARVSFPDINIRQTPFVASSKTNETSPSLSYVHSNDKPRIELLTRLDDSRWAYCPECLLLKPRKKFKKDALLTSALERRCTQYDGVVEVCLCSSLTLRDRRNLINFPQSHAGNRDARYGRYKFVSKGKPLNEHLCPFYSKHGLEVRRKRKFSVSSTGILTMNVWYSVRLSTIDFIHFTASPVFACPHVDLIPLVHKTDIFTPCKKCAASIWREPKSVDDPDLVTFRVKRTLGWGYKWADRFWHSQCHDYENRAGKK